MAGIETVIAGVVVDVGGSPVEGARVYFVESPVPLPDIAILTDSSGRFKLSAPVPGTYWLEAAHEGSEGVRRTTSRIDVHKEQRVDLEVRLVL